MEHSHFGVVQLCCGKVESVLVHVFFNVVHHLVLSDKQKFSLDGVISFILYNESLPVVRKHDALHIVANFNLELV